MLTNRFLRLILVFLTGWLLFAGCTPSTNNPAIKLSNMSEEMPKGPGSVWHLVVISESSGWGLGDAYASQIEKDMGVKVVLEDFAMGDLSAGEVLQELQTGKSLRSGLDELPAALRDAEVVVMFGNPMDLVDSETAQSINSCFAASAPTPCTPKAFEKYTADLKTIWTKVFELRSGKPTILRAIDVASPFVNSWKKSQVFDACTVCWECVTTAVRQAAEDFHVPFLSRYDIFNGVKHDEDPAQKGYIGSDGIHPNDLAQQRTAELLSKLGYKPVPPP